MSLLCNVLPWDLRLYSIFISFIPDETLLPLGLFICFHTHFRHHLKVQHAK